MTTFAVYSVLAFAASTGITLAQSSAPAVGDRRAPSDAMGRPAAAPPGATRPMLPSRPPGSSPSVVQPPIATLPLSRPPTGSRPPSPIQPPIATIPPGRPPHAHRPPPRQQWSHGYLFYLGTRYSRYDAPAYYYPRGYRYQRWVPGQYLPRIFLDGRYRFYDYRRIGLSPLSRGYIWVRFGPDLLIVNDRNGRIRDVLYDVFY
ncbi:MAG: RcnB family protein [Sphingomonadaceae bacterium]